jgi:FAD:protein FMN transferase
MLRRDMLILLAGALAPGSAAAQPSPARRLGSEQALMGTLFSIVSHLDAGSEHFEETAAAAFRVASEIEEAASDYREDSELLALSRNRHGEAVVLSPLLFRLLAEARKLAEQTGGLFDPTLGPLTKLWREARRRGQLPEAETLAAARAACGWQSLVLDPEKQTAILEKPGMRLDLGGIAKGQAADAMLAIFQKAGLSRSSITAGGDVRVGSAPPDRGGWRIGIRGMDGKLIPEPLELENAAVSTSGDLHQFVEIAGTRYAHIIDPATGLGLTRRVSATVVAPTATLSDALATACCAADPARARELALQWGASEAVILSAD